VSSKDASKASRAKITSENHACVLLLNVDSSTKCDVDLVPNLEDG